MKHVNKNITKVLLTNKSINSINSLTSALFWSFNNLPCEMQSTCPVKYDITFHRKPPKEVYFTGLSIVNLQSSIDVSCLSAFVSKTHLKFNIYNLKFYFAFLPCEMRSNFACQNYFTGSTFLILNY